MSSEFWEGNVKIKFNVHDTVVPIIASETPNYCSLWSYAKRNNLRIGKLKLSYDHSILYVLPCVSYAIPALRIDRSAASPLTYLALNRKHPIDLIQSRLSFRRGEVHEWRM
jgi:hypothetical protein